jgi:pantothenate kinase
MVGISGAPGSGKSTFAAGLATLLTNAHVVPMDGFHFADVELDRRGIRDRKGAPDTFDAWGYAALLGRLRTNPDHLVMAPGFDRDLEQPLAGSIPIPSDAAILLAEGNYLLLNEPPWQAVRNELGSVWHIHVDDDVRRQRLVSRHVQFGKTLEAAKRWVELVDEPNARRVQDVAARADLIIDLTSWTGELLRG